MTKNTATVVLEPRGSITNRQKMTLNYLQCDPSVDLTSATHPRPSLALKAS
jgi:hypothetical protein